MYKRILVAIDGSPTGNKVLAHAASIASACRSQVRVLHILEILDYVNGFERPGIFIRQAVPAMLASGRAILQQARKVLTDSDLAMEEELVQCADQRVAEIIVAHSQAWKADLIVLGTHGRRGFNRLMMGSDAELVVRNATLPVLLVKADPSQF